jgi:hypothetical protein
MKKRGNKIKLGMDNITNEQRMNNPNYQTAPVGTSFLVHFRENSAVFSQQRFEGICSLGLGELEVIPSNKIQNKKKEKNYE